MIIRGGDKHLPQGDRNRGLVCGVAEAAVIGPPGRNTARSRCCVSTHPGVELGPEAITEHLRTQLARYKQPVDIIITDTLPKNPWASWTSPLCVVSISPPEPGRLNSVLSHS